ncbi:MAG: helix-turn-helix domain-containing protein [Burkholderiaceae bacterium]
MSVPNRQFDESLVRVQAQRLQDARLALGLTIHDFIQPLSTSRAQLDAVERANLDAFYAPFYYERLFRRYAEALSFASETIDEMVAAFTPEAPSGEEAALAADDNSAVATDQPATPVEASPAGQEAVNVSSNQVPSENATEDAAPAKMAAVAPQERDPGRILASAPSSRLGPEKRNSGFGWVGLVVVLSIALVAAWLFTDQGDDRKVVSAEPKPAASTAGSEYGSSAPAETNTESKPAGEVSTSPSPAVASAPSAPASAVPAAPPTNTGTPAMPAVTASSAAKGPAGSNSPEAAAVGGVSGAPAMEIVPTGRSWIWVRQADDSIREFAVAAGERVVFEQMPIYIVLARPEQAEVKISGRPVRLGRNDAERDLGRFGRSQLIEARSQGSTPSVPLAPRPAPPAAPAASPAPSATPSAPPTTTPNP